MEITFETNELDYMYLYKIALRRKKTPRYYLSQGVRMVILIAWVLFVGFIGWQLGATSAPVITISLPIVIMLWLSRFVTGRRAASRSIARLRATGAFGRRSIQISPANLQLMSQVSETKMRWEGFTDIVDDPSYIFFYTAQRTSGMPTFYISKRAFPTPDQAQFFFQTAIAYWQGKTPPDIPEGAMESTTWPPPPKP